MMSDKPLISVLMTAYNREKFIEDAIKSVLNSSYQNLELIISDDNSTDQTVNIANRYASLDSRVKVFINTVNKGDYANRNQAAKYASGKYLKYLDSDDYIYPWGLEMLVSMMEEFPEAGWGLCSLVQIAEKPYPFLLYPKEAYEYNYFKKQIFAKSPLSAIIKKDVFDKVEGFKEIRMVGDFEMWHRIALYYPVLLMPDGIVWNRVHAGQEVNHARKYLLTYEKIRLIFLNHPDLPLGNKTIKIIIYNRLKRLTKDIFLNLLRMRFLLFYDNLILLIFNLYNFRKHHILIKNV